MENFEKPRKNISKLGIAGAAVLGTLASQPADAAGPKKAPEAKTQMAGLTLDARSPVETVNWFAKGMNSLHALLPHEIVPYEDAIEKGEVPLSMQIAFLEKTLKAGSHHYRELQSPNLPVERFSKILKVVDAVSARMTLAYAEKKTAPELQKYFNIQNIAAASRYGTLQKVQEGNVPAGAKFNNSFLARSGEDVYLVMAKHGISGTVFESEVTAAGNDADTVVRFVAPTEYRDVGIQNKADLPEISDSTTLDSTSGHVVVSYSAAPANKQGLHDVKVHFSFAMPFAHTARTQVLGEEVDQKYPYAKSTMMFLKPHGEAEVAKKNPDGSVITRAVGSSGSIVGVLSEENGQYKVLGNFVATNVIEDTCRHLCHAISLSATPEALKDAIRIERSARKSQG